MYGGVISGGWISRIGQSLAVFGKSVEKSAQIGAVLVKKTKQIAKNC